MVEKEIGINLLHLLLFLHQGCLHCFLLVKDLCILRLNIRMIFIGITRWCLWIFGRKLGHNSLIWRPISMITTQLHHNWTPIPSTPNLQPNPHNTHTPQLKPKHQTTTQAITTHMTPITLPLMHQNHHHLIILQGFHIPIHHLLHLQKIDWLIHKWIFYFILFYYFFLSFCLFYQGLKLKLDRVLFIFFWDLQILFRDFGVISI